MLWQDIVLMIGGFLFALALLPTLRSAQKPPTSTCVMTAVILLALEITYATLGLWLAVGSTVITKAMWLIILFQGRKHGRRI